MGGRNSNTPTDCNTRSLPASLSNTLMKQSVLIISLSLLSSLSYGQSPKETIFSCRTKEDSLHYSKTNFTLIDSIDRWCYKIIANYKPSRIDSTVPLCQVHFTRSEDLVDSSGYYKYLKLYGPSKKSSFTRNESVRFKPYIIFRVYSLKDSVAAFRIASFASLITSCAPPYAGGDLFIAGSFIFVNDELCLKCSAAFGGEVDYCRPLLNFIFSSLKNSNAPTVEDLLTHLPIKKCN